jgi:hypothetical protein
MLRFALAHQLGRQRRPNSDASGASERGSGTGDIGDRKREDEPQDRVAGSGPMETERTGGFGRGYPSEWMLSSGVGREPSPSNRQGAAPGPCRAGARHRRGRPSGAGLRVGPHCPQHPVRSAKSQVSVRLRPADPAIVSNLEALESWFIVAIAAVGVIAFLVNRWLRNSVAHSRALPPTASSHLRRFSQDIRATEKWTEDLRNRLLRMDDRAWVDLQPTGLA